LFKLFSGDDASPGHWMEEETKNRFMNYSLAYSSKQYEEREYTMTVRVYTEITFFREEIATSNVKFRITKQLNGDIAVLQKEARGNIVSSKDNVEFKINLHDPSGEKEFFYILIFLLIFQIEAVNVRQLQLKHYEKK
jgi:hypothetical protein